LIDKVKYAPIKGKYKVYIIDEVHMMTSGAFNALLKTLEEPPSHVLFILATTEPHKILPTILSRCQRFDFGKVNANDLRNRIELILKTEKITFDDAAIQTVIQLADGGVRDALSILDQVIAYTGGRFQESDLLQLFGLVSSEEKINLFKAIGQQDQAAMIQKIEQFIKIGADFKRLLNDLLMMLKDVLILVKTQQASLMSTINESQANRLLEYVSIQMIPLLVNVLMTLQLDARNAQAIPGMLQLRLLQLQPDVSKPKPQPTIFDVMKKTPTPSQAEPATSIQETGDGIYIDDVNMIKVMVTGDKDQKNDLIESWKKLDELLYQPKFAPIAVLLKDGRPYVLSKHILVLELDQVSNVAKFNIVQNQSLIQAVIKQISGYEGLVYAINRQEAVKLKKLFMDLSQLNKLPGKQDTPPKVKNWNFQ
jgi:DNA polymerase-3 subunit gamma/tau